MLVQFSDPVSLYLIAFLTWQKNKISPGSLPVATARIAPKICEGQPPTIYSDSEYSRFYSHWFAFGGVLAERVNTGKMRRKVNPIFGWSLASSQIIISFKGNFPSEPGLAGYLLILFIYIRVHKEIIGINDASFTDRMPLGQQCECERTEKTKGRTDYNTLLTLHGLIISLYAKKTI